MPAVTQLGSSCSGHGCWRPRPNIQGSPNVFVNGIAAHRQSDAWATHCCGKSCHDGMLAAGSSTVYCNDLQLWLPAAVRTSLRVGRQQLPLETATPRKPANLPDSSLASG